MEDTVSKLLVFFTLFSGWPFRSSGKKRLRNQIETVSAPSTPQHSPSNGTIDVKEVERTGRPISSTQPIAIQGRNREEVQEGRSYSHSLPSSYRNTPDSTSSSTPRSFSSSQYNSIHNQIWQQAFRNGCR